MNLVDKGVALLGINIKTRIKKRYFKSYYENNENNNQIWTFWKFVTQSSKFGFEVEDL